jgi:hypothetical protein
MSFPKGRLLTKKKKRFRKLFALLFPEPPSGPELGYLGYERYEKSSNEGRDAR